MVTGTAMATVMATVTMKINTMGLFANLFTKHILNTSLLQDMTDLHSHLLPGVDDGFQTLERTQEALKYMASIGVKRVFFTPHTMADLENTAFSLRKRFEEVKEDLPVGIEVRLASEYMLDDQFSTRLDDLLTIDRDKVLVETSYLASSPEMDQQLYQLRLKGFQPILAHPERYRYMKEADYARLKKEGVFFQLNLLSLSSLYGKEARMKVKWLLNKGYYDFVGTDIHRLRTFQKGLDLIRLSKKEIGLLQPLFENTKLLA